MKLYVSTGSAIAQAVSFPISQSGSPSSILVQVTWYLWWTKWHWGMFLPSTSVSPASSRSVKCSTRICHPHSGLEHGLSSCPLTNGFSFPPAHELKKLSLQVFYLDYYDGITYWLIVIYQLQIKYEGIIDSCFMYRRLRNCIGFITSSDSIMLSFDSGRSWGRISINL
jgi:hypothetical protein